MRLVSAMLAMLVSGLAWAGGGPLGIDHPVTYDHSSLYKHSTLNVVEGLTFATTLGGALWEGGQDRLGRTYWQTLDSMALGAVSSTALKYTFTRSRPAQSEDPNLWFQGKGHYSFPSGEVTFSSAAVTPFVLEYGHDNPWVYALEVLPAYTAVQRVKTQAHWQSDVLAGWALGFGTGWLAHQQDNPWILRAMPGSVQIGFKTRF
ncbi:MAG TPA: phosphatase PAP2 family protein [Burkholderiales bacterium]|nr:phosphatase PAP2 family protein [Burkholderiales bacterium]